VDSDRTACAFATTSAAVSLPHSIWSCSKAWTSATRSHIRSGFITVSVRFHGKCSRDRVAYIIDRGLRLEIQAIAKQRCVVVGANASLFVNRLGTKLRPQSVRSRLHKTAKEAGLARRATPHMLRHTAATLLIETGVDIRIVQRLLGHSSIAATEIYTHVSDEILRTTFERANVLHNLDSP
jgi:integrase/recombinase XerD